jgi:hypothetical protein
MKQVFCVWQDDENIPRLWFATKEAAETAVRMLYPNESIEARYSRIYERNLVTMNDLQGLTILGGAK